MRYIISEIRTYILEFGSTALYLITLLFLGLLIWANYFGHSSGQTLEQAWIEHLGNSPLYVLYRTLGYFLPYVFTLLLLYIFRKDTKPQWSHFWVPFLCMLLFALTCYFNKFRGDLLSTVSEPYNFLVRKIYPNLTRIFTLLLPLAIFYWFYRRYSSKPLAMKSYFGLTTRGFHWRPYVLMLWVMVPLIVMASFLPAFQQSYPSFRFKYLPDSFPYSRYLAFAIYEVFYLFDFLHTELFFRGVLVVFMVRYLGPQAILPMVSVYCVLHFGKPMGETISSIFGGFILGILAYRSGSILGGCFIHVCTALLMDIAGAIHYTWAT